MTTSDDLITQEPEPVVEKQSYYVIDPDRTREFLRSPGAILFSHRCPSCQERLEGRWSELSEKEQFKEIAECCATQEGFIRPDMPMQEIIFREILSGGNAPIDLEQLHYLVTDRWYTPSNPRNIRVSSLKRVLDNDTYYGFKEVSEEAG